MRIVQFSPAAQAWLGAARPAHLLNVFDRACNLVDSAGEVLSLVTTPAALAPCAALAAADGPAPFQGLTVASAVRREPGRLRLDDLTLTWADAGRWDPRPDWAAVQRALAAAPEHLEAVAAAAYAAAPAGSLLELSDPHPPTPLLHLAAPGAAALVRGLAAGESGPALAGVAVLAGLGGGLTPAGDDFIVGALLAAWAGLCGPGAVALAGPLADEAARRTTTLSGAYLRAAARGECSAAWHAVLAALQAGDALGLAAATAALAGIGHTSGADGLAGFLANRLS
ncbi:MAG: DUF2877 domain-containing protein [Anaerolineales bacterium]|nr:DUF2877 domain-containing protein [Anaerolineales bacterium]